MILSRHALDRARTKNFVIPERIDMRDYTVIEIETSSSRVEKLVIRGKYDDYDDIVMVVIPRGGTFFVKTAWLNAWNDNHFTLDTTKYAKV